MRVLSLLLLASAAYAAALPYDPDVYFAVQASQLQTQVDRYIGLSIEGTSSGFECRYPTRIDGRLIPPDKAGCAARAAARNSEEAEVTKEIVRLNVEMITGMSEVEQQCGRPEIAKRFKKTSEALAAMTAPGMSSESAEALASLRKALASRSVVLDCAAVRNRHLEILVQKEQALENLRTPVKR